MTLQSEVLPNNAAAIRIHGAVVLGPSLRDLNLAADTALQSAHSGLIVNLSGVTRVDSAGLGELVNIYSLAGQRRRRVVLSQVPPKVLQTLRTARLERILLCFENDQKAVEHLLSAAD